ncbi:MAG TPA: hypothetical protein VD788_04675, partial [Candidatus Polarisedimenticolaceae bacterium]|nr:hypothetical protein [Candidatus Polarisedimenticolaceae bacterium]
MRGSSGWAIGWVLLFASGVAVAETAGEVLVLGRDGVNCGEDPHCINRLHPAIPLVATARPGQTIVMHTRNASDFALDPAAAVDSRAG